MKKCLAHSMPASPAYKALLHQAAVGRFLSAPAQPVAQEGGQFTGSIVENCQPSGFQSRGMANFSASSGSKPEPYIVDKGGNNGDI